MSAILGSSSAEVVFEIYINSLKILLGTDLSSPSQPSSIQQTQHATTKPTPSTCNSHTSSL
jgi:hypothetical protein